jgi:hypothetical protein
MKQACMIFLIPGIFFFANYGDNQAATNEKQLANNSAKSTTENPASATSTSDNGIVGTWKLTMEAFDDNNNSKLDDEERKSGMKISTPQVLRDYKMQFNSNGTCTIEGRYNGTYKIKEEDGKKILLVELEPRTGLNGKQIPASHNKYYIKSITSSELLLLAEVSGVAIIFRLFKKV